MRSRVDGPIWPLEVASGMVQKQLDAAVKEMERRAWEATAGGPGSKSLAQAAVEMNDEKPFMSYGSDRTPASPHCKVCFDAKAAEQQGELGALRITVKDLQITLKQTEEIAKSWQKSAYEAQRLVKAAQGTSGGPVRMDHDPTNGQGFFAPISPAATEAFKKQMQAAIPQFVFKGFDTRDSGAYQTGVDSSAPEARVCRKSLPNHPITLNEDEKKCWQCGNGEFEG